MYVCILKVGGFFLINRGAFLSFLSRFLCCVTVCVCVLSGYRSLKRSTTPSLSLSLSLAEIETEIETETETERQRQRGMEL